MEDCKKLQNLIALVCEDRYEDLQRELKSTSASLQNDLARCPESVDIKKILEHLKVRPTAT